MFEFASSWSITRKLVAGFGVGVAGLATVVFIASLVFASSNAGLERYRDIASSSNQVGRIQANTLLTRMQVKDYLLDASDSSVEKAQARATKGLALAEEAIAAEADPTRRAELEKARALLDRYASTFDEVAARGRTVKAALLDLSRQGSALTKAVAESLGAFGRQGRYAPLADASEALEQVMRARMAVYEYLAGFASDLSKAERSAEAARARLAALPAPYAQDLGAQLEGYRETLAVAKRHELARRELVRSTLDTIGPQVADLTERMKLADIDEQEALGPRLVADNERWLLILALLGLGVGVLVVLAATATAKSITGPVQQMGEVVEAMARGDFSGRVEVRSADEIGQLAQNVNRMADDVSAVLDVIQSNANTLGASSQQLSAVSHQLLGQSAKTRTDTTNAASAAEQADGNLGTIASASVQMNASVENVSSAAEQMSANMQSIAAAAEEMSETMNVVAASVEEMTSSIAEVANNAGTSSKLSDEAMSMVRTAAEAMRALRTQGDEIGKVTDAIKGIADQTNLLALNATIEAASAGASGRGFAVVASEVKALAVQSGQAADDIADRIAKVQAGTRSAADAMNQVASFVERVNQSVDSIASAVTQQSGAATEISQSVAQSSQGAQEIARNVAEATQGASEVARSIGEISVASRQVSQSSSEAALGVSSVSSALVQVRDVAAQNDEGSKQVSEAANDLATVASELQEKVQAFRFTA